MLVAVAAAGCEPATSSKFDPKKQPAEKLPGDKLGSGTGAGPGTGAGHGTGTGAGPGTGAGHGTGTGAGGDVEVTAEDLDSKDILGRTEVAAEVDVKHVLLGWKELSKVYGGRMDPRAAERSNADSAKIARDLETQLRDDPTKIDELVKKHSEDPGSIGGDPYTVTADASYVPEFKDLALRLKLGEAGIVKSQFGYHVMVRVTPPPPDPLESSDIMGRPANDGTVQVQHILIGWKDTPASKQRPGDPRAAERTKEQADKIATEVLAKVRAGGNMEALMKEYSEDPGSKDTGRLYEVNAQARLVDPFKKLSMRLNLGEAGLVKSPFGWHVIKRVPPPPPDSLESTDIMERKPVTEKGKVKHILLGWSTVSSGDPRAAKRDRKELETLVGTTLARLKKGEKIEALMKELSEDPGSAESGDSYDVSPDAQLVPPFKDLSLRLNVGEVGVVKTDYGIHIIQRVE